MRGVRAQPVVGPGLGGPGHPVTNTLLLAAEQVGGLGAGDGEVGGQDGRGDGGFRGGFGEG